VLLHPDVHVDAVGPQHLPALVRAVTDHRAATALIPLAGDELGLLPPAHVDLDSGYRWYACGQVDQARLVASLRQIGVPLAQIKVVLGLDAPAAAGQVAAWWTGAEAQHAARRELASYLVDRLNGKRPVMYEIAVRDIPARSLLTLLRYVHADEQIPVGVPLRTDVQRGRAQR
jgi:DNA-binding transcriptional MerR regulator